MRWRKRGFWKLVLGGGLEFFLAMTGEGVLVQIMILIE
jgi:hypothetical protein